MTREEYTDLHKRGLLRDTRIHEELLVRPVLMRENGQKKIVKKM
jgi:hypothetical protein